MRTFNRKLSKQSVKVVEIRDSSETRETTQLDITGPPAGAGWRLEVQSSLLEGRFGLDGFMEKSQGWRQVLDVFNVANETYI